MGRAIVYCDQCGDRILPEDLEKGRAGRVGDSHFCPTCVGSSPVKLAPAPLDPHHLPRPQPAAARGVRLTGPAPAPRTPPVTARRRTHAIALPRRSPAPLLIGAAVAAVALGAIFLIPVKRPEPDPPVVNQPAPPAMEEKRAEPAPGGVEGPAPAVAPAPPPVEPAPSNVEGVAPPAGREEPKPPPRPWHEIVDDAYSHYRAREYAQAKELYLQAMPLLPTDPPKGPHEAWWHYAPYNLATVFSMESASLSGQARADAQGECRRWLAKALAGGYTKRRCRCHGSTLEHFRKDEKFAVVRSEAWFQELLRSVEK